MIQFREGDVRRIVHACEYYRSMISAQDPLLAEKYDKVIHKLHSYGTELECPNCWDPESSCEIHA